MMQTVHRPSVKNNPFHTFLNEYVIHLVMEVPPGVIFTCKLQKKKKKKTINNPFISCKYFSDSTKGFDRKALRTVKL